MLRSTAAIENTANERSLLTRRQAILGAAAAMLATPAYPLFLEPRWLELTRRRVKLAIAPSRILHLSDLHYSRTVPLSHIEEAITLGLAEKPDVVCLTGDFITYHDNVDLRGYSTALGRLAKAAPTFAVPGNHDGGSWAQERRGYGTHAMVRGVLQEAGIQVLLNRSVRIRDFTLVGLGDLWSHEVDGRRAFAGVAGPAILLAHNPDTKDVVARFPWDLMLSGHTHGGQVRLPIVGDRYTPVKDKRYIQGLKPWGDRQIHVTRGVGNVSHVRFRCRPEVSLLEVSTGINPE